MKKHLKPLDWKILIPIANIICWVLIFTLFDRNLLPKWLEIFFFLCAFPHLLTYVKWENFK